MKRILPLFALLALFAVALPANACNHVVSTRVLFVAGGYSPAFSAAPVVVAGQTGAGAATLPAVPAATIALVQTYTPSTALAFFTRTYGSVIGTRLFDFHFGARGISRFAGGRLAPVAGGVRFGAGFVRPGVAEVVRPGVIRGREVIRAGTNPVRGAERIAARAAVRAARRR